MRTHISLGHFDGDLLGVVDEISRGDRFDIIRIGGRSIQSEWKKGNRVWGRVTRSGRILKLLDFIFRMFIKK